MDKKTISRDGTPIAYTVGGEGPPVVLVTGAMTTGAFDAPLAGLLAERFTVVAYDRRGRGDSGDTPPYAVEREFEDLAALVDTVGGTAALYGMSSGAALALLAAASGLPVSRVAAYEPPYAVREGGGRQRAEYSSRLQGLLAQGRRGDAVELFVALTGASPEAIRGMRHSPAWPGLEAVAPTLAHDDAVMGDGLVPRARLASVGVPVLALAGGASPAWMREAAAATAGAVPDGTHRVLEGQGHMVDPGVLAPVLTEFFAG
ncbi:alpha/beta fold hydrolase [Streptomyces fructofermentans]|uniref:Alpha/beta hydrolase n=1 Tax=Streptomyces fructofermentans TaxID=152141 RepID=A0A918KQS3_9ACTN|nr:alpha/beta hydrolase [Streptomyces fructofermentans]GGX72370.1 alpha/beta hydrolase [Streptomyces fructofermentans]